LGDRAGREDDRSDVDNIREMDNREDAVNREKRVLCTRIECILYIVRNCFCKYIFL
jgi:hypothetical protein